MSKPYFLVFAAVVALFLVPQPPCVAEDTPMSYAMFAFLAGGWREEGGPETLTAAPFLGEGMLRFDVSSVAQDGSPIGEMWIVGFDPAGKYLYMDVYSPGGWRSAMDGKMIAPGAVWVFETPAALSHGFRERRVVSKITEDEIAIKYQAEVSGAYESPVEKKYKRVPPEEPARPVLPPPEQP